MLNVIDRLREGTSGHFNFNSWPDKLEIVNKRALDLSNAAEAYDAGMIMGRARSAGELRQIDGKDIPGWMENQKLISIFFVHKQPAGQEDDIDKRNILAIWSIRKFNEQERKFIEHIHVWEIGCKHTYDDTGSRHSYGYHKGKCTKCGHRYLCDSGD